MGYLANPGLALLVMIKTPVLCERAGRGSGTEVDDLAQARDEADRAAALPVIIGIGRLAHRSYHAGGLDSHLETWRYTS